MKRTYLLLLCAAIISIDSASGAKPNKKKKKGDKTEEVAKKAEAPKGSIEAVLTSDAKHYDGLFNVVEQKGKYYFLLPTETLGRDFLLVTRISKASAGLRAGFTGYAGDPVTEDMFRFMISPDSTSVFIQSVSTSELPRDSTGDMYENVMRSNFQPLAQAFKVEGKNKSGDTLLIEATEFLTGDNELTSFSEWTKRALDLSQFQKDRAYVVGVESFPINTEIKTVKTYLHSPKGTWGGKPLPQTPVSFELNTSIIELPKVPMQPRYADSRVGYFTERYVDFDKNPQGIKTMAMITRWRLEPKEEDMEAYMRGELVEPKEPIVFYIDPTTPEKWVDYLIQGVNDWEPVFRKAGFKNAIRGERAPVGDSTWSLNDARHSAIVYKPSTIPNASGPHVNDPRSGQILESHINWYHNVMLLLRNWYMLQVGPNDQRAQQMTFPDELMGQLIRFVSSHEVGHTLGLRHNFGSTAMVPVDSLRSASYLKENGHTPSIMDYSRFNYVVQPEDNIDPELLFPRIEDYDIWAIEWGYTRFPELSADGEKAKLNEWIIEKQKDPRLWFGHEMNPDDPRSQSEDLGDNQMEANELGIKNLKRVIDALPEWTKVENEGYANLGEMYDEVLTQYLRYVGHVAKWVGGIYENPMSVEQGSEVYSYVSKAKQQEAMRWLNAHFFKTPQWLMSSNIFQSTGANSIDVAMQLYNSGLGRRLVNYRVMNNLIAAEDALGSKAYTITEYFADLNRYVFNSNPTAVDRVKQKAYVNILLSMVPEPEEVHTTAVNGDALAVIVSQLRGIESKMKSSKSNSATTTAHYRYLAQRISEKLDK